MDYTHLNFNNNFIVCNVVALMIYSWNIFVSLKKSEYNLIISLIFKTFIAL